MNAVLRHMYTQLAVFPTPRPAQATPSRLQVADFPSRHRQLTTELAALLRTAREAEEDPVLPPSTNDAKPTCVPPCSPSHTDLDVKCVGATHAPTQLPTERESPH